MKIKPGAVKLALTGIAVISLGLTIALGWGGMLMGFGLLLMFLGVFDPPDEWEKIPPMKTSIRDQKSDRSLF